MQEYEIFIKDVESIERISIEEAQEQTIKLIDSKDIDDDWRVDSRLRAYHILDLISKYKQNGDADDFHNYAVTFARINDYDAACLVLKYGLKRFPYNVDLLADFLIYAPDSSSENRYEECDCFYAILKKIDKRLWTWRGFDFSIQYLVGKLELDYNKTDDILNEVNILVNEYLEYYPLDEKSYLMAYMIKRKYSKCSDVVNPERYLEEAVGSSIKSPRCALKLAEKMFDKKEFDKALELLNNTIYDSLENSNGVSLSNAYLLRYTIKISSLINKLDMYKKIDVNEELVSYIKNAYLDYRIAKELDGNSSKIKSAYQYIKIIEVATGIAIDDALDDD